MHPRPRSPRARIRCRSTCLSQGSPHSTSAPLHRPTSRLQQAIPTGPPHMGPQGVPQVPLWDPGLLRGFPRGLLHFVLAPHLSSLGLGGLTKAQDSSPASCRARRLLPGLHISLQMGRWGSAQPACLADCRVLSSRAVCPLPSLHLLPPFALWLAEVCRGLCEGWKVCR